MHKTGALYLGCNAGMNYFIMKGSYLPYTDGISIGIEKRYEDSFSNRIGVGLILEYELRGLLSDHISSSIKINPEFTGFDEFGKDGASEGRVWLAGWINFHWVIKYNWK